MEKVVNCGRCAGCTKRPKACSDKQRRKKRGQAHGYKRKSSIPSPVKWGSRQTSAGPQPLDPGAYGAASQSAGAPAHIPSKVRRALDAPVWPVEMGSPATAVQVGSQLASAPTPDTSCSSSYSTPLHLAGDEALARQLQQEDQQAARPSTRGQPRRSLLSNPGGAGARAEQSITPATSGTKRARRNNGGGGGGQVKVHLRARTR